MKVSPENYWRNNKNWSKFIGKIGKVILSTKIEATSPELELFLPYCFVIVELEGEKYEVMGEKDADLERGDQVRFVLRKISNSSNSSLINYGVKVVKNY